uniref:Protein NATD1 n=1 Tax=Anopheles farauti TaxID=69004 RepID=A0A182QXZ4_9DIPT
MSCMLAARTIVARMDVGRMYGTVVAVKNDPKREKFVIDGRDGNEAFLKYSEDSKQNVIRLEHTYVPDAGKGKGLGKQLVEAAFQYAIERKLMVRLECDFTVKYYKDNEAKYKAYVTK